MLKLFQSIPQNYEDLMNQVQSKVIQKLFDEFNFFHFPFTSINNNKEKPAKFKNEDYLFNYFKNFKFITIRIFDTNNSNDERGISLPSHSAIICVEGECIIIERIPLASIVKIIDQLKEQKISVLNISSNLMDKDINDDIYTLRKEIKEFSSFLLKRNCQNKLINSIVKTILCYSIQRYTYPTYYFKDASFFLFDKANKSLEQEIKGKIKEFLRSTDHEKLSEIEDLIKKEQKDQKNKNKGLIFKEEDFFYFRNLPPSNQFSFHLVIHLESFYPFIIKKAIDSKNTSKQTRVVDFCDNYSHRCLMPYYGVLESEGKQIGVVYEYICNNTFSSFIKDQKVNQDIISLMFVNRIFQGIEFLHLNNFVDRDLKPLNILMDHDFLPFISDFDTIRHPSDEQMTGDVGSTYYSSPEQDKNENVTLKTDIYSFGLIIYFIFTGKDMFDSKSTFQVMVEKKKGKFLPMQKGPINFQNLYEKCINLNPDERPSLSEIKSTIIEEVNSFYYFENFLQIDKNNIKLDQLINCIYESFMIISNDSEQLKKYKKLIILFGNLLYSKINENDSSFFQKLGDLYFNGYEVNKDYLKAKEYFLKAAQLKNETAIQKLHFINYQNEISDNKCQLFNVVSKYNIIYFIII